MALTDTTAPVRSHRIFRLAGCFAVPAILLAGHLAQGADTPVSSAWLGLLACFALGGVYLLRTAEEIPAATFVMFSLLGIFVCLGWTGNWHQARPEILQLATAILIWTCGAMLARSHKLLLTSIAVLTGSLALFAALALLSYPILSAASETHAAGEHAMRLSFSFLSPNTFASLMGLGTIVAAMHLAYLMRTRVPSDVPVLAKLSRLPRESYASIFALFFCASCLLLSLSRAGIILTAGCLATIAVTEIYLRRHSETLNIGQRRYVFMGAVFALAVLAVLLLLTGTDIGTRASRLDTDGAGRWALVSEFWQAWQARPLFGHGLGSFNRLNESMTTMDTASTLVLLGAAHNVVLQWLIQAGLAGLAVMAGVQLAIHARLVRNIFQSRNRTRSYVSRMAMTVTVFLLLHSMIDFPLEIPSVMWTYAFLLGLAYGMPNYAETRNGDRS